VEAFYRARFSADGVKNLDVSGSASKGPEGAPVVIVEFADFECPACAAARPVIDELFERQRDKVRVVFKHFPLGMHPNAEKAARAAVAADRQGKFWELHAAMFENQTRLAVDNVEKLAEGIGLDMAKFRQDRDSEATADVVARDRKHGEALALDSTPSLFINGRPFPSTTDFKQDLEDWVALELTLKGVTPAPAALAASSPPSSVKSAATPAKSAPAVAGSAPAPKTEKAAP
jgi:protein-disulfide isomerase